MRPYSLLWQTVTANLLLVTAAVLAAVITVDDERFDFISTPGGVSLLLLAFLLTVVVNLWLIQRRFLPLEQLIDAMEKAELNRPQQSLEAVRAKTGAGYDSSEVERLELAFVRMLERLEAQRRRSSRIALEAQERERARVAHDLHDEVNQALTGILLHLEAARSKAPPDLVDELTETKAYADQAMAELLRLARQLRPTSLDDLGLKAALAGMVEDVDRRSSLSATFDSEGDLASLPAEVQLVVYRVAQEALSNAVQHADASRVGVHLSRPPGTVSLDVADDGEGFSFDEAQGGMGLEGMQERALLIGATLQVTSRPGEGTTVTLAGPAPSITQASEPQDGAGRR
ncbi:MAG: sensor histidine kinase [Solirubrobacterales bacterium]